MQDPSGGRYLDLGSGWPSLVAGHRHPRVLSALIRQAGLATVVGAAARSAEREGLVALLQEMSGFDGVRLCASRGEVGAALSARRAGEVLSYGAPLPGAREISDAAALQAAISADTAAVVLSMVGSEVRFLPDDLLASVRAACTEHGAALVIDETATGLGRTGALFSYGRAHPDAVILGSALGGGVLPITALLTRAPLHPEGACSLAGGPLSAAVAAAVLETVQEEGLADRAAVRGRSLRARVRALPQVREVRGRGLLIGVELATDAAACCAALATQGVLCRPAAERVIRLAPPLVISEAELELAADAFAVVLR